MYGYSASLHFLTMQMCCAYVQLQSTVTLAVWELRQEPYARATPAALG